MLTYMHANTSTIDIHDDCIFIIIIGLLKPWITSRTYKLFGFQGMYVQAFVANMLICIHNFNSDPKSNSKGTFKSIRKAVELAKEAKEEGDPDKLSWYLAMTDSLIGNIMIMSADKCTESEQKNLGKV